MPWFKNWKIVVKDNIAVSGWPLTCASRSLKEHIAAYTMRILWNLYWNLEVKPVAKPIWMNSEWGKHFGDVKLS